MQYFSTNGSSPPASFRDAVLAGQPADRGLYFPSSIPKLDAKFVVRLPETSNAEIAFEVIKPFVAGEIDDESLYSICAEVIDFDFPIVSVTDRIAALELFHGPTFAFKDVGARFMSRCLAHFAHDERTVVIVATSGDTGGAVAAGFYGVEGVDVVILYPKGRVSEVQELQLTRLGGNVITLELQGSFDDCQAIAKQALSDVDLQARANLTSANSINIARWLPQQFYYFLASKQMGGEATNIAVPCGNFGNLAAGMLAQASGLPVKKFVAACNANDVVPRFLIDGRYEPRDSVATLSNAMDVGDPSNFVRIQQLTGDSVDQLKRRLAAVSVTDATTADVIRRTYADYGYVLDPHGAVAFAALSDFLSTQPDDESGIFLETAHPVKFDSVSDILDIEVPEPPAISGLRSEPRMSIEVENDFEKVKAILLEKI